jgi:hypothetical protein
MALTGSLLGDFSSFVAATEGAIVKLKTFEEGASTAEKRLNTMTNALSGVKIVQQATLAAEAVERMGGVSTLTASELAQVGATATEAAAKLTALGQNVPPAIQKLADAVKPVPVALQQVSASAQPATGFLSDLSGSIVKMAAGFVSAQAVIGLTTKAFHELADFAGESIKAFADAEAADVKLTAALRQHSLATPEVIAQYAALGAEFQRTTTYSDDEIQSMERLLTQVGGVMPSAMQGALKAATDLAAGLGIDLQSATNLVAKAAAGHTETLGRYGITVSQAALETKGFDAVLEAVNRQFGGQSQAALDTYAGKIQQLENSWNNAQESIGKFIVQNPLAVAAMRALQEAAEHADKSAADAGTSWASFIGAATGVDPHVIVLLEGYAEGLNTIAEDLARINGIPNPFEKLAAENTLPTITAGMKLFNVDAAAAAQALKAFEAGAQEVKSAGDGLYGTLGDLDEGTLQWMRDMVAAGVSVKALEGFLGLTTVEGRKFTEMLRDEGKALKVTEDSIQESNRLWAEHFAIIEDRGASASEKQINAINREFDAEVARLKDSDGNWQNHWDALDAQRRDRIDQVNESQRHMGVVATEATKVAIDGFHAWNASIMETTRSLDGTILNTKALIEEQKRLRAMGGTTEITRANFAANAAGLGGNTGAIEELLKKGYSFEQALLWSQHPDWQPPANPGPRVPGFAGGVQNFGGGLAMVGERGPELVNLPGGSDVIPLRGGGGGSLTVHMTVSGLLLSSSPAGRAEFAKFATDAITQQLLASGWRPPLGARR